MTEEAQSFDPEAMLLIRAGMFRVVDDYLAGRPAPVEHEPTAAALWQRLGSLPIDEVVEIRAELGRSYLRELDRLIALGYLIKT